VGETLRVGTSGDYPPFSVAAAPGGAAGSDAPRRGAASGEAPAGEVAAAEADLAGLGGLDVELLSAWARERGAQLEWVRFRWPDLSQSLASGAFDVAVGGITVRPERTLRGVFTRPVVVTGAVALVRDGARFPDAASLARARIAVNAGGHLERVARALFPRAQVVAVPDNRAPPRLLAAGEVDAALTDGAEAPLWRREAPGAHPIGPLTRDAKAWWVRADRPELARELDAWLAAREADGHLARVRAAHLGVADSPAAAAPLAALLAAVRERLELAPLVAEAKRAAGLAVDAPEQEERVLAAAVAATHAAAERAGRLAPPPERVRAFFRAQIDAGKELQRRTLAGPPAAAPPFDLDRELRPALARTTEKIAALAIELAASPAPPDLRIRLREELAPLSLSDGSISRLGDELGF
jgi:cyclohexadienyl dehydratase